MGEVNEQRYFSVRCIGCQDQAVVQAPNEGAAELIWLEFKPCRCNSGVYVVQNENESRPVGGMPDPLQTGQGAL